MDRDLYNDLVAQTSLSDAEVTNGKNESVESQCLYQVQEKKKKINGNFIVHNICCITSTLK